MKEKIVIWFIENWIVKKIKESEYMKSWKTTTWGIVAAIGSGLSQVKEPSWIGLLGQVMAAAGLAGVGIAARDNDKSSEDVNVKP